MRLTLAGMAADAADMARYDRQTAFADFGPAGQRRLHASRSLIVGVGGLGSWVAELLARAGAGTLRLVDADRVELNNIHRQAMYDEADAAAGALKVEAARKHLKRVNGSVVVETVASRLDGSNISALADGVDLVIDGTDNFPTRFLINDYAVKTLTPWIFAGVVGAEAQAMSIIPGRTACLRCIYDSPPPPCVDPTCRGSGVLGPAVAAIAAFQAAEAIKILAGRADKVSPYLLKMDLWENQFQRIDAAHSAANLECPCCKRRLFEFLEP